jgi:hypothetical protein
VPWETGTDIVEWATGRILIEIEADVTFSDSETPSS